MYDCGYSGRILYIDLTSGSTQTKPLPERMVKDFVGSAGINVKIAYDLMGPEIEPLSDESAIIFGAGVFQGTPVIGAAKVTATYILPSNNEISTSVGGGSLGVMLKLAGYDHVIITGRAPRSSYITIFDDDVRICDANDLWGKHITTTTDLLWAKHGGECSVFAIGPAGENLIPFSIGLLDKAGHLGKGGLGAAMGSKNLKALVVRGTKGVKVADRKRTNTLINELYAEARSFKGRESWVELGLLSYWDAMVTGLGGLPSKNGRILRPAEEVEPIFGVDTYRRELRARGLACPSCTLLDKYAVWPSKEPNPKDPEKIFFISSFLGVVFQAASLGLDSYEDAIEYHGMNNRLGLDKHTTTSMLDYLMELYEKGIITEKDTGGIHLDKGYNIKICKELLQQIVNREGIGKTVAGGWNAMIERFGKGTSRFAIQMKNISPALEPRLGFGTDKLEMIVGPRSQASRGGSPTLGRGSVPYWLLEKWALKIGVPDEGIKRALDKSSGEGNMGRLLKYAQDWMMLLDCLGICGRPPINRLYYAQTLPALYTAITGIEIKSEDLLKAGDRIMTLERWTNSKRGFDRREDEKVPLRFLEEPITTHDGQQIYLQDFYRHGRLTRKELDQMMDDYYEERGWNRQGIPTMDKLKELELI